MSLDNQPLPSEAAIDKGIEAMEADVAEMFGFSDDTGAAATDDAAPSDDAAPGGEVDQAPPSSPDTSPPADGEQPSTTSAAPEPGKEPAPAKEPPAAPGSEAASTAPPAAPDEQALKVQSLEATVEALQAQIAASRASPDPGSQPPAGNESGGTEAATAPPKYDLTLPQPVAAAIFSDDPQQQQAGVVHMMNNLAAIVHHNVRLETRAMLGAVLAEARKAEQTTDDSAAIEAGRQQYFAAFPDHKNELLQPLIAAEATKMTAEFPNLKWGPDYINALGTRVNNRVAALAPKPSNAPPSDPAPGIPAGINGGRREGTPISGEELIADTFS
jgi:hypothetical protein